MTRIERQRVRRAEARADLAAIRADRLPPAATVVRMTTPPLPEAIAIVREVYGPGAVIVVEAAS